MVGCLQLTEEESGKRYEKREKNKMAAQKCREKKRRRIDELEAVSSNSYIHFDNQNTRHWRSKL